MTRLRCVLLCPPVQSAMGNNKVIPETHFVGTGRSKKIAEQAACMEALELYRSNCLVANPRVKSMIDRVRIE